LFRVGFGYDVHRLVKDRPLILGAVRIPHSLGLLGHSDADVLIHAVIDAILGALAKGDIGQHFPDSDPANKGIESLKMLEKVVKLVKEDSFLVNNIDSTIIAEKPKLAPYIQEMRNNLARVLEINIDQVSVKATTSEGLGFCGRQEGMAAYAVASLICSS
jgi:2-C-methyl-D-erythritol 2,4-cyclodiphosphate synthase